MQRTWALERYLSCLQKPYELQVLRSSDRAKKQMALRAAPTPNFAHGSPLTKDMHLPVSV